MGTAQLAIVILIVIVIDLCQPNNRGWMRKIRKFPLWLAGILFQTMPLNQELIYNFPKRAFAISACHRTDAGVACFVRWTLCHIRCHQLAQRQPNALTPAL
jgi:hypothetical protein